MNDVLGNEGQVTNDPLIGRFASALLLIPVTCVLFIPVTHGATIEEVSTCEPPPQVRRDADEVNDSRISQPDAQPLYHGAHEGALRAAFEAVVCAQQIHNARIEAEAAGESYPKPLLDSIERFYRTGACDPLDPGDSQVAECVARPLVLAWIEDFFAVDDFVIGRPLPKDYRRQTNKQNLRILLTGMIDGVFEDLSMDTARTTFFRLAGKVLCDREGLEKLEDLLNRTEQSATDRQMLSAAIEQVRYRLEHTPAM